MVPRGLVKPEIGLQQRPFRYDAAFGEPRERDQQLARQGDDPDLAQPRAPGPEAAWVLTA
jgi:hypothetical protein